MQKDLAKLLMKAITLISTSLLTGTAIAGSNFTISPTPGKTFPTSVSQGAVVSAYYTITNNTHSTRSGYRIQGLPARVVQNTSDPGNCANLITLASHASCILQLDISGEARASFALCKGVSCTSASVPLNVSVLVDAPQQTTAFVVGGSYINTLAANYPFVALSSDGGSHWSYTMDSSSATLPADFSSFLNIYSLSCSDQNCILPALYTNNMAILMPVIASSHDGGKSWAYTLNSTTPALPGDYNNAGNLYGASCSGQLCVAGGYYFNGATQYPLIAVSNNGGAGWSYKVNSTTPVLPADFTSQAIIYTTSCSGMNCIGSGQYLGGGAIPYPFIASSNDSGLTWSYTLDSATPAPPVGFISGSIYTSFCSGQHCLASGQYNNGPLLATSIDGGQSWSYTIDASTPALPGDYSGNGYLNAVSCSGLNCMAVGAYNNGISDYPLLAASSDGGLTWSYKINSTTPVLPVDFASGGSFDSVSCSGQNCVAAGTYSTMVTYFPLLAISNDAGLSWRYAIDSSTPALPIDFINQGYFYAANCNGDNCIAAGMYNNNGPTYNPLLASSKDGGATWAYTIDNSKPTFPADYGGSGQFISATTSVASMLLNDLFYNRH